MPQPADEGAHEPGPEDLWSESWYFDVVDEAGEVGAYHRIARLPNAGSAVLGTCIVRRGLPTVMLQLEGAPLPEAGDPLQSVESEAASATHECSAPLERFAVRASGTAQAHADHSAPLRREPGESVEIAIDLAWETDGIPYQWRRSTRYEIPCRVSGTMRIGDETVELNGPGQRDHSWGARDWWGSDWTWSALHLSDGTHTHGVSVPNHPRFCAGYVQRDGELTELTRISSAERVEPSGLIAEGQIGMDPGDLELRLEPLASSALLLEAPDGRITHFPRAMCRVQAGDGREGLGWVEWNRNQAGGRA